MPRAAYDHPTQEMPMACLADSLPAQVQPLRLITDASRLGEGAMQAAFFQPDLPGQVDRFARAACPARIALRGGCRPSPGSGGPGALFRPHQEQGAGRQCGPGFPRVLVAPGAAIPSGTHVLVGGNDSPNCREAVWAAIPLSCRRKTVQQMSMLSVMQRAAERQADMLVVGRDQSSQCRLPFGHVAENIIGRAHCAVLIVAAQKGAGDSSPDTTGAES